MDERKYIFTILQRNRISENETWTDAYALPRSVLGKEEDLLRQIVHEFLRTPTGKEAEEDTMHDFNWGDVGCYIPQNFFAQYGVFPLYTKGNGPFDMGLYSFKDYAVVSVNQDEILCD